MTRKIPEIRLLKKILVCDPEKGILIWLPRDKSLFGGDRPDSSAKTWNAKYANTRAFTNIDSAGYFRGRIWGVEFYAHRVIWKMCHGEDPGIIDHINGNHLDNRLCNLRIANVFENAQNASKQKSKTTSVFKGVCSGSVTGKWRATIRENGRLLHLGTFENEVDAAKSYDLAAVKFHGDFARLNFPRAPKDWPCPPPAPNEKRPGH